MPPNPNHDAIVASSDVSAAATRDGTWMREISRRRCARVIDPPGRGSLNPWAATAIRRACTAVSLAGRVT